MHFSRMARMARRCMAGLAPIVLLAGTAMAEPFRLIVTDLETPLVPNSVMDLALQGGYFAGEGVDVVLVRVQQTPSALAALQAGEGEMANISIDALLQRVIGGAGDLRAVTSPNRSLPFLIVAREEIATPRDLSGRSFGVGRIGSLDHALSMKVLAAAGADTEDLEIVTLGQPGVRAQALAAGRVDATTMSIGVWNALPDRDGLAVLIDQDAYHAAAPVVNKVNVVSTATLETRRAEVEGVIRALIRISRDAAETPSSWVDAMARALPHIERGTLEMLAEAFRDSWSINGGMSAPELAYTQSWLYEGEDFRGAEVVPLSAWVDFGPVDAALADLGVAPGMDDPAR